MGATSHRWPKSRRDKAAISRRQPSATNLFKFFIDSRKCCPFFCYQQSNHFAINNRICLSVLVHSGLKMIVFGLGAGVVLKSAQLQRNMKLAQWQVQILCNPLPYDFPSWTCWSISPSVLKRIMKAAPSYRQRFDILCLGSLFLTSICMLWLACPEECFMQSETTRTGKTKQFT